MDVYEKAKFLVKATALGAVFFIVVWWDISSQMKFTEHTRAGIYEAASQRQAKAGEP